MGAAARGKAGPPIGSSGLLQEGTMWPGEVTGAGQVGTGTGDKHGMLVWPSYLTALGPGSLIAQGGGREGDGEATCAVSAYFPAAPPPAAGHLGAADALPHSLPA